MADVPRTKLQPRPVRIVHKLRVSIVAGPDAGATCAPPVEDGSRLAVGTAEDNALVVRDAAVSRYHLELHRTPAGVEVIDLGSRNGTWVGNVRITRAIVPAGTQLRLGDTTLVVEDAGNSVAPPPADVPRTDNLVGDSDAIREVARLVHRVARVDSSVLIQGETGTGKEVVARAIHEASPRRDRELVIVDCGSMPASLIASILFGHEKGAFTGADQRRAGAFERAEGGTVLLDEIGELPLDVQPALLGVLERRAFTRVGGAQSVAVDVRVLAATHRDLRARIREGTYREDLLYRLDVVSIELPALRHRREDIPLLLEHFLAESRARHPQSPVTGFTRDALALLLDHAWPGNVRELAHVVERAVLLGNGAEVTVADLPAQLREPPPATEQTFDGSVMPVRDLQRRYARWALERLGGHKARTAAELGVDVKTLNRWLAGDDD